MNDDEIRTAYIEELLKVAPDLGAENIGDESHLQNDLGLDSMDILNFVTALHERLGVSIPEIDYPRIATVQEARAYLARALA